MVYRDNHDQRCMRAIAQRLDEQGSSIATIARTLDVSTCTVKRWRSKAYREEQPRGRPVEFEQTYIAPLIHEFLRGNMNATLEEVRVYLAEDHDVNCTTMMISRLLKKDAVTCKKVTYTFSDVRTSQLPSSRKGWELIKESSML